MAVHHNAAPMSVVSYGQYMIWAMDRADIAQVVQAATRRLRPSRDRLRETGQPWKGSAQPFGPRSSERYLRHNFFPQSSPRATVPSCLRNNSSQHRRPHVQLSCLSLAVHFRPHT